MSHSHTLPRTPSTAPHHIRTDEEALEVARQLVPVFRRQAAERDRHRILPWDEIERYTASGLGGITVPRAYGGAEVSYATLAEVFALLSAADPSLGQIPQNHFAVLQLLREIGTAEQQQRWFGDVLSGHRIGNAGPEKGPQSIAQVSTRISRTAQGLRLNGTRFYSTGALFAHWIPLRALDDTDQAVQVWVRRDAAGVEVVDDWSGIGQRTTASGTVRFNDVPVADGDVVALVPAAQRPGLAGPVSQLIQAAIDAGIAQAAFDDALAFVQTRTRPWTDSGATQATDDPYIIQEVGQLQIEVAAAQQVLLHAARELDEIARHPVTDASSAQASITVARAKILTTEAALNASENLFALAGSSATREAHNLDRHWRNARVHTLHDPVRWKYHLLGNYLLNGVLPRRHQWN